MEQGVLVLDFGMVLAFFDRRRVAQNLQRLYGSCMGLNLDEVDEQLNNSREGRQLLELFETGRMTEEEYFGAVVKLLSLPAVVTPEMFWAAHCDMFTPNEPVLEHVQRAQAQHPELRTVLFSDVDPVRARHTLGIPMVGIKFDHRIMSCDVGHWKPHTSMYQAAEDVACCHRKNMLYFDDKPGNVKGGKDRGWTAHLYDPANPHRDTDLGQALLDFLRQLAA